MSEIDKAALKGGVSNPNFSMNDAKLVWITPKAEEVIAYCARVSNPKNQNNPNISKLLSYCIREKHWCYDDQTEVLTDSGFIPFHSLTPNDLVAAYDILSKSIQYEPPSEIYSSDYDGEMIHFTTHLNDLLVTPNHRILAVTYDDAKGFSEYIEVAQKLVNMPFAIRGCILNNNNPPITIPVINSPIMLKLIGLFLKRGYIHNNLPTFHLKPLKLINYLHDLCDCLEIPLIHMDTNTYSIALDSFTEYILGNLVNEDGDKVIPEEFHGLSAHQFSCFLEGMTIGESNTEGITVLEIGSKDLADSLQRLVILNGLSCTYREGINSYFVYISRRPFTWTRRDNPYVRYKGKVYCCSVSTGLIVVRRNNKVSISGNSIFEMASMCVEVNTSRAITAQITRHRSLSFQEFSLRYAPALDLHLPEVRRQDPTNRQNSIDDLDQETKDWWYGEVKPLYERIRLIYEEALGKGIAKECARGILPLSTASRLYASGTIRSWIHYLMVRANPKSGTQKEHFEVACKIKEIFKREMPIIYKAALEEQE